RLLASGRRHHTRLLFGLFTGLLFGLLLRGLLLGLLRRLLSLLRLLRISTRLFFPGRWRSSLSARLFTWALLRSLLVLFARRGSRSGPFAHYVLDRARCECFSGCPFDRIHARAFVGENRPLASVKVYILAFEILNRPRPIDNGCVIYDQIALTEMATRE